MYNSSLPENAQTFKQLPGNPLVFKLGVNHAFCDKNLRSGYTHAAFGNGYIPSETMLAPLIQHILSGGAFTPALHEGNTRKNETWISSQMIVLDYDDNISVADCLANPFIRQNAALIYPTPSSKPGAYRTRVIFILSELVDGNPARWAALTAGVMRHAGLPVDQASKKPAQPYYGSTNRVEQPYINYEAVLPIEVAGALTVDDATEDMLAEFARRDAPPRQALDLSSDRAARYAAAALDNALSELTSAGKGGRNEQLFKTAANLFGMSAGGWPGIDDALVERELIIAGQLIGLTNYEVKSTIASAHKKAEPRPLELPPARQGDEKTPIAQRVKPVDLLAFTPDLRLNLRYISDLEFTDLAGYTAVNIKSAMATGKTELIPRRIEHDRARLHREPTLLYITHRAALVESSARRLGILSYTDLDRDTGISIKSAPQLAITVDSLYRVAGNEYDLVVIDEITQVHQHLEGDTMRAGEHRRAYAALKGLTQTAGRIFGLDAQNTDTATRWLAHLTDELVLAIENTYQPHSGESLSILSDKTLAYEAAQQFITAGEGPVYIACSSKTESDLAHAYLSRLYPDKAGMLINSDNSQAPDVQQFILNINAELPHLAYLVVSPSLSTGVDITAQVRAVIGIFGNRPIAPPEMVQMIHRCRNAQERAVFVQSVAAHAETDWPTIYRTGEENANMTAELADFAAHGIQAGDADLRGIHRLLSEYRGTRNQAMNDPLSHVVALLKSEGYAIEYSDGQVKPIRDALRIIRQELKDERKRLVLTSAPVSYEDLDQHRLNNTLTPEIRAGHERYKIEDSVGLTISEPLYNRLKTAALRQILRRRANMLDSLDNLKESDREEATEGRLYSKRSHSTARRMFVEDVVKLVFGCSVEQLPDVLHDLPAADLETRANDLAARYEHQLTGLLGWRRGAHSQRGVPLLRYILLNGAGIKMESRQVMRDGQRFMVYGVDLTEWEETRRLALARLAHLARKRTERLGQPLSITKNLLRDRNQVFSNAPKGGVTVDQNTFAALIEPLERV